MKKRNLVIVTSILLIAAINLSSCKKDSGKAEPFVFYSLKIDGSKVTFTNQSKGAASYRWDFGDGTTSAEQNPVHTYPGKGKYVPTLYATAADGAKAEASTVIRIAKTSPVKLDDNTLSDWDAVKNVVVGGAKAGNFVKAKYDYDGNYIYIYFEQKTTQAAGEIYDVYIDADNNPATGYASGGMPNAGYDVLFEGTLLDGWFDPFYFDGTNQSAFNFKVQSIAEFYKLGTVVKDGGTLKYEWAISRSKIKGLTGTGLKIFVQATKSDWSQQVGYSPDDGTDAFFLDMAE